MCIRDSFKGGGFTAELLGVVIDGLDGKADAAFDAVHLDHAGGEMCIRDSINKGRPQRRLGIAGVRLFPPCLEGFS